MRFLHTLTIVLSSTVYCLADDKGQFLTDHLSFADSITDYSCLTELKGTFHPKNDSEYSESNAFGIRAQSKKAGVTYFAMGISITNLMDDKSLFGDNRRSWQQSLSIKGKTNHRMGAGTFLDDVRSDRTSTGGPQSLYYPVIDPFVVVILPSADANENTLWDATELLLNFKFLESYRNDNGNMVEKYLSTPQERFYYTFEFGKDQGNRPIKLTVDWTKKKPERAGHRLAEITTKWKEKPKVGWLPVECKKKNWQLSSELEETSVFHWRMPDELPDDYFTSKSIDPEQIEDNRPHFFRPFMKLLKTDFEIQPAKIVPLTGPPIIGKLPPKK
jgi:hypothetical protein